MTNGIKAITVLGMAEGTRFKTMEESLKRNEAQIGELRDLVTAQIEESKNRQDEQQRSIDDLKELMRQFFQQREASQVHSSNNNTAHHERLYEQENRFYEFDSLLLTSSSYGSDSSGIQSKVGYDDRTLLIKVHVYEYSISWEELDRIFSPVGSIEYIEVFDQGSPFHSRIRFIEPESAVKAIECFDGRCIYNGCCRMELLLGDRASKLSEIDVPHTVDQTLVVEEKTTKIDPCSGEDSMPDFVVESQNQQEDHKGQTRDLQDKPYELNLDDNSENFGEHDRRVLGSLKEDQGTAEFKPSMVILNPIVVVPEIEYGEIRELVKESMALIDIKWIDIKISSLVVDIPSAYKVFDVLPRRETVLSTVVVDGKKSIGTYMNLLAIVLPYDRDGLVIFDPGGVFTLFVTEIRQMTSFPSEVEVTREAEFLSLRWQWDPGGKA